MLKEGLGKAKHLSLKREEKTNKMGGQVDDQSDEESDVGIHLKSKEDLEQLCDEHRESMDYWCEKDDLLVCKHCLIFGSHRGHSAVLGSLRSENLVIKIITDLKMLRSKLEDDEKKLETIILNETRRFNLEFESLVDKELLKWKEQVDHLLTLREVSTRKLISQVKELNNTTVTYRELLIVSKWMSDEQIMSTRSSLIPGIVTSNGWQLTVTLPYIQDVGDHKNKTIKDLSTVWEGHNLLVNVTDNNRHIREIRPQIMPVNIQYMRVVQMGTPALFYCMQVEGRENNEKIVDQVLTGDGELVPVERPRPGQGVLVDVSGGWRRATVIRKVDNKYLCLLVDRGIQMTVSSEKMFNIPESLSDISPLLVSFSVPGCEGRQFNKEAVRDWERLVGRRLIQISSRDSHVDIQVDGQSLLDLLVFLGHVPGEFVSSCIGFPTEMIDDGPGVLCPEQDQPSPDQIYLYLETDNLKYKLQKLDELQSLTSGSLVGPVIEGSSVLAPWQGEFYRARVLSVSPGPILKVLYVDHGNTDWVDWWDCTRVPPHLIFPPLANNVRLGGGLICPGDGNWKIGERLRDLLNSDVIVVVTDQEDKGIQGTSVDLLVEGRSVADLLLSEGLAEIGFSLSDLSEQTHQVVMRNIYHNEMDSKKDVDYKHDNSILASQYNCSQLTSSLKSPSMSLNSDRSTCNNIFANQTDINNSCHVDSPTASTVMRDFINLSEMIVSTDDLTFTAVFSHVTIDGVVWVTPDNQALGSSIPLKLYGVKKIKSSHNPEDLSKLWLAQGTEVNVVIIYTIENGPLPAKVRYTKVKKYDGNLALEWISTGLYDVVTSARDWTRELHDHNISTSCFHPLLSFPIPLVLPHPLPLAVNQWYHVTIEAVEYPLDKNLVETEPDLSTPHANRVGVHMVSLNIDLLHRDMEDIGCSLSRINGQVDKIMSSFSNAQKEFKNAASVGFHLLKVDKENILLAPYQESEWCRVNIHQDVGDGTVIVFFIDYGHRGRARLDDLRAVLNKDLELQPSQLVQVNFSLPDTESELDFKRRTLEETSSSLVMKVEHISESDIVEVSFWKLEQEEKISWFKKIC